jgi:hypothetical protein
MTINTNEVNLMAFRFRNIGSINASDLGNFRLYISGVQYGSAVEKQDENGYVEFDFSDSAVNLNTGSHVVKVLADVTGGSSRTVTFTLRDAGDAVLVDEDYGQPVLVQANSTTFSARTAGAQTINSGTLTMTKMSNSASGEVTDTASNQSLASFELKAFGEDMKVENLAFNIAEDDADTAYNLRNGAVYADGVQIGSTTAICSDDDTASCSGTGGSGASYTLFTFGSSLVVVPGTPVVFEVRADVHDSDGTDGVASTDTIQLVIDSGGASSNVLRKTTGDYVSSPSSDVTGNTLTVSVGALTVAKNGSYANQTMVAPRTPGKLGSFTITNGTVETVNLNTYNIDFDTMTDAADASSDLTNLYLMYGPSDAMVQSTIKGSVADTSNSWSIDYALAKGGVIYVDVYADAATSVTNGDGTADTLIPSLTATATGADSATSISPSEVVGQTITFGSGTFTTSVAGDSPVAAVYAANQEISAAKFDIQSQNENYYVKEVQVAVGSVAAASVISEARLYDGSTLLGSAVMAKTKSSAGDAGLVTGLNWHIPSNTTKTLTVKLLLNDVGTGLGSSQQNLAVILDSVKYADSQGAETTNSTDRTANEVRVYKTVPTLSLVDQSNSTLVNGTTEDLYSFTVTAAANGSVAVKQFKLTVAWSDGGTADTLEVESLKLYKNGSNITSSVTMVDDAGNDVEGTSGLLESDTRLVVTWSTEDVASAGETVTYTVRGTPQGFRATGTDTVGDSVSLSLVADASHNGSSTYLNDETDIGAGQSEIMELFTSAAANTSDGTAAEFIWSDRSSSAHASAANASSSSDWANGYLLLNLDLDGETWLK